MRARHGLTEPELLRARSLTLRVRGRLIAPALGRALDTCLGHTRVLWCEKPYAYAGVLRCDETSRASHWTHPAHGAPRARPALLAVPTRGPAR